MRSGILVISYDGILEPLGQSQVLAYLEKLSLNHSIFLISFEKADDWGKLYLRYTVMNRMKEAKIEWRPLRYHKRPAVIATAWDIFLGAFLGFFLVVRHRLGVIHARSYVPSVMALFIKGVTGSRYLFDMRGFWVDERVDGGLWSTKGLLYCISKSFERHFLLKADHIVTLTRNAVNIIESFSYLRGRSLPVTVIPTCTDLLRFKPVEGYARSGPFVLGYVGTVGTWYMFKEVALTFAILLRIQPNARFLVVNRGEHDYIRQCLKAVKVPESSIEITSANYLDMPELMARMHAGIFFIKPVFSKQASAPTKLAEFLGCGIPCLGNTGVGDMAEVLEANRVGVAIKAFDQVSLHEGLIRLLRLCDSSVVSDRCVAIAHRYFSLDEGVARYGRIYNSLGA